MSQLKSIIVLILVLFCMPGLVQNAVSRQKSSTATLEKNLEQTEKEVEADGITNQIKFNNATSLESLLLETIRLAGLGVCSSQFTRDVMLGLWRTDSPSEAELSSSIELRKICYATNSRPPLMVNSSFKNESETDEEVTIFLIPQPPETSLIFGPPSSFKTVPRLRSPPKQKHAIEESAPADPVVLRKMNEIIQDRSADCKPRKIPVEIPPEENSVWLPACALVERCGGCCKHEMLECVPAPGGITSLRKKVVAMDPRGSIMKVKQIDIEKHSKCRCACKVQASDCNSVHTYDSRNCRCVCKNKPDRPCIAPQYWDDRSCQCRCQERLSQVECSSGTYFDPVNCRCASITEIMRHLNKED